MANHPQNGDLPEYPETNVEEYLSDLTMQAGATYDDDGDGNHPKNGDLPEYPETNIEEYLAYLVQAGLGKVTSGYFYNGKFYKDAEHTQEIAAKSGSLYYDVAGNSLYVYVNSTFTPVGTSQVGKFLSSWDCSTGLAGTEPSTIPYEYKTGDFYMTTNVGETNYKPNGSTYTGTASTTEETGEVADNDFYFYDGTTWFLLKNSHPEIPTVVQETGTSLTSVMSQNAVTEKLKNLVDTKAVKYTLYSDGNAIYSDSEMTTTMTYAQIKALVDDEKNIVVVDNGNYELRYQYKNAQGEENAIWFNANTMLAGKPYLYRIIINSNDEVLNDEIELADSSAFTGATSETAGTSGLVPAPQTTDTDKFLKGDGTWGEAGGSGPTVVQTIGTSTTDVMSQNAITSKLFRTPGSNLWYPVIGEEISSFGSSYSAVVGRQITFGTPGWDSFTVLGTNLTASPYGVNIGTGASSTGYTKSYCTTIGYYATIDGGDSSIAIGAYSSTSSGVRTIVIGNNASISGAYNGSIAIGGYSGSNVTAAGMMDIGSSDATYGYGSTNYRLITGVHDGQGLHDAATVGQAVGENESYTIEPTAWTSLSGVSTYTYSTEITATHTIGDATVIELLNDQPALFATYGFAAADVSGQNIKLYSIGQPSDNVTLKINYKG